MPQYELRCRECGKSWGNQPRSICDDCFSPLEVSYDYDALRSQVTREQIAQGPPSMWRYSGLLPLPENFQPSLPTGFTPLFRAPRLAEQLGAKNLYIKNDAVCLPTLSFKDRVVAVALAQAREFGFEVVSCSSTGNLANSVAAQAARNGFKAVIFIPADLEPAKILGTQVFGARLVRISGSYDQVNRLCSQIADERHWGFVNVNLRPYYAEGSKTVGFEIAEQLGWRLPRGRFRSRTRGGHPVAGRIRGPLYRDCRRRDRGHGAQAVRARANGTQRNHRAMHHRQRIENHRCAGGQVRAGGAHCTEDRR